MPQRNRLPGRGRGAVEESNDEADEDQQEANEEQLNRVEARLLARLRAERGGQDDFDRASVFKGIVLHTPVGREEFRGMAATCE